MGHNKKENAVNNWSETYSSAEGIDLSNPPQTKNVRSEKPVSAEPIVKSKDKFAEHLKSLPENFGIVQAADALNKKTKTPK